MFDLGSFADSMSKSVPKKFGLTFRELDLLHACLSYACNTLYTREYDNAEDRIFDFDYEDIESLYNKFMSFDFN